MILRRLIEHVKAQNWTAVALDFLIVVVGVFMGIQLGNWNAERADNRLAEYYVDRLIDELTENRKEVRAEIIYYEAVLESVQRADKLLALKDSNARDLIVAAYRASEIIYSAPGRATWDQIVSSGDLALLPEGSIESGLLQFYAFNTLEDVYRMGLDSGYRQTVRKIIPIAVQIALREGCSDVRNEAGIITGFVEDCVLDVAPEVLEETAAALRAESAVADELRYQYSFAVSAALNIGGVETSINGALAALGENLGDAQ